MIKLLLTAQGKKSRGCTHYCLNVITVDSNDITTQVSGEQKQCVLLSPFLCTAQYFNSLHRRSLYCSRIRCKSIVVSMMDLYKYNLESNSASEATTHSSSSLPNFLTTFDLVTQYLCCNLLSGVSCAPAPALVDCSYDQRS
jgi:hypothetical protein